MLKIGTVGKNPENLFNKELEEPCKRETQEGGANLKTKQLNDGRQWSRFPVASIEGEKWEWERNVLPHICTLLPQERAGNRPRRVQRNYYYPRENGPILPW